MTYIDAIVLGIIQGLTEFLPVSSSGHLVIGQALLGVKDPGITLEVLVHFGTLMAVILYFRRQIATLVRALFDRSMVPERRMVLFLIIGTIPAGVAGVLLEDFFEQKFGDPAQTSAMLIVTGLILLATRFFLRGSKPITATNSLVMGIGQAAAILPGISRSGSTIAAGIYWGVSPAVAAEFSFLLSVPVIIGAIVFKMDDLAGLNQALAGQYAVATMFSFVFGLAAVSGLMAVVRRGKLEYFAYYCFAAGALGLYIFL